MSSKQQNPYIGPRTFQRNEGHLFFGREREARDLTALVASERLVLFYAQSGAGKSSIVNTRLIPNLEEKEYEVLPVGRVSGAAVSSGDVDNIFVYNLIHGIVQQKVDLKDFPHLKLAQFLAGLNYDDDGYFFDPSLVAEASAPLEEGVTIMRRALVIDQFEELLSTHPEAWEKRDDFFIQLAQAMEADPYLWVVLVMREDFVAALDPYAHHLPGGLRVRYYMQRLGRDAALAAVKSPVEELRPYAPGMAEKLVDDLCSINIIKPDGTPGVQVGQYVEPVQLQVVCYGLWENLPENGTEITKKDLEGVGDVDQSLGKHYDNRVRGVAQAKKVSERLIREWFEKKLITSGGIRNMVLQEREKKKDSLDDDVIQALQSDLVRAEKRGGATWYELTHDRLVAPILERNKVWFEQNLSPLQRQAALWNDQNQNESWLLRDQALEEVKLWAKYHDEELTNSEREFLEACQKLQNQLKEKRALERKQLETARELAETQEKAAKRARLFNGVSVALVVVAIIATIFSLINAQTARENEELAKEAQTKAENLSKTARANELATFALNKADSQLDLSILLGLQADVTNPTTQTQQALLTLVQKSNRYIETRTRDEDILQVQYSPDGEILALLDKTGITFWDAKGNQLNDEPINGHYSPVGSLALSHDGKYLASGGGDGTIVIWDAATRKMIGKSFQAQYGFIKGLAFSPDDKLLASASSVDSVVKIWDMKNPSAPEQFGNDISIGGGVICVAFSPDGKMLAVGDSSGYITLWDVASGTQIGDSFPEGHTASIYGLVFINEKYLASGSYDDTVIIWDVSDAKKPRKKMDPLMGESPVDIETIAASPDGKFVAAGDDYGNILIWNIATGESVIDQPLNGYAPEEGYNWVVSLAFSPDGKTLAAGYNSDGHVILWDMQKLSMIGDVIQAHKGSVWGLAFASDGKTLISGSQDNAIQFWDVSKLDTPIKLGEPLFGHLGHPTSMAFSPDGSLFASSAEDGQVMFDTRTRERLGIGYYNLSPNGEYLVYQITDPAGKAMLYIRDAMTGKSIGDSFEGAGPIFSPDGNLLVYTSYDDEQTPRLHILDLAADNKELKSIPSGTFIAFSPDSRVLVYQPYGGTGFKLADIKGRASLEKGFDGVYIAINSDSTAVYYQTSNPDTGKITYHRWDGRTDTSYDWDMFAASLNGEVIAYVTDWDTETPLVNLAKGSTGELIAAPVTFPLVNEISLSQDGDLLFIGNYDERGNHQVTITTDEGGYLLDKPVVGSLNRCLQKNTILVCEFYGSDSSGNGVYTISIYNTEAGELYSLPAASLISLLDGGNALIYSTSDGVHLRNIKDRSDTVLSGEYKTASADEKLLVLQSIEDNGFNTRLWDIEHNRAFGEPIKGEFIALSPDGRTVITRGDSSSVVFWNLTKTWPLGDPVEGQPDTMSNLTLNVDGNVLAWIEEDGVMVKYGDTVNGPYRDHVSTFPGAFTAFSPDGGIVAIGNYSSNITMLWDLKTLKKLDTEYSGFYPTFSPDGKTLAIGNSDNTTKLWDLKTHQQIGDSLPGYFADFSPDGKWLAIGNTSTGSTIIWDVNTREPVGKEFIGIIPAFSPDGKTLAVGIDSFTRTWDVDTGEQIDEFAGGIFPDFNSDGSILAVANYDINMTLWDVEKHRQIGSKDIVGSKPTFGPGGILAAGSEFGETTTFWTINDSGKKIDSIGLPTAGSNIILSSNGKSLASFDPVDGIAVRNLETDEVVHLKLAEEYSGQFTTRMNFFDNDTKFAVVGSDGILITWDLASDGTPLPGEANQKFPVDITNFPVFSPDGNHLVFFEKTSSSLKVWDARTSEPSEGVAIHIDNVSNVVIAFSPNGTVMALGDGRTIHLYNFPQLTDYKGGGEFTLRSQVIDMDIVMDGENIKYIFTLDGSGNTQIWDYLGSSIGIPMAGMNFMGSNTQNRYILYTDSIGQLIKFDWNLGHEAWQNLLCPAARRNFTQAELETYFPSETSQDRSAIQPCPQ